MNAQSAQADHNSTSSARWPAAKARQWYEAQPWLVGCNYIPATAINQLEMWQADTFDLSTIDRELKWAHQLGFTSVRVFLHNLLWENDREGFLKRMEQFLETASKHRIGVMFVLFDSVWDPYPRAGKQPEPRPGVMGSAWVQAPGAEILTDRARHDQLKDYVVGVVGHFRDDPRVQVWDVWNEPDNPVWQYAKVELPNKAEAVLPLMKKAFAWAREARPTQPLTSGVWQGTWSDPDKLSETERFQLENSDVISFHSYAPLDDVERCVSNLRRYERPILCTEYMARPLKSTVNPILGYFADQRVGAYNWGFVLGKTQTNYPWDSWSKTYTEEPHPWFHDLLYPDGKPYKSEEVNYIKQVTGSR